MLASNLACPLNTFCQSSSQISFSEFRTLNSDLDFLTHFSPLYIIQHYRLLCMALLTVVYQK
jgi:hypothetical protein